MSESAFASTTSLVSFKSLVTIQSVHERHNTSNFQGPRRRGRNDALRRSLFDEFPDSPMSSKSVLTIESVHTRLNVSYRSGRVSPERESMRSLGQPPRRLPPLPHNGRSPMRDSGTRRTSRLEPDIDEEDGDYIGDLAIDGGFLSGDWELDRTHVTRGRSWTEDSGNEDAWDSQQYGRHYSKLFFISDGALEGDEDEGDEGDGNLVHRSAEAQEVDDYWDPEQYERHYAGLFLVPEVEEEHGWELPEPDQ
ncbi:hypothetical protein BV25DRAFT_1275889 [Artomyces pyxidatus]|uniref:Uncharacterized protein n=1 Tax=Artomyces pyxidatus TaxID=48021 RepID=A0ACB8TF87_9AGAM|nr:hypothetical protein BV25DRAFT_1275889 [Artomyces pyxidatus]